MSYLLLRGIYSGPTGNIGIGSNNPQSSLDISGNVTVTGSILPSSTLTYDLGTPTKRWRDIYLSGNTIDLDGALIQKEVGGGIKIADASGNTLDGKFNNIDISGNAIINGNIIGNIIPNTNLAYDLGAPDKRWNDLYLSGNTIDLSGTLLSRHTDGSLMVHDSNNNMISGRFNHVIAEGDVTCDNLNVNGTTTTINSTTVTVQDPIITLGSDITNTKDKGIEFKYDTGKIGFFGYDDSTGNLTFLKDASNNSEVFTGTQGTIEGLAFKSSILSGTAPLTVTSSTLVSNLNADLLDGLNNDKFMRTDISTSTTGTITSSSTITGTQLISTVPFGTAPLSVTSSTLVTNLNSMLFYGLGSTQFMRSDINTSTTGNVGIGIASPATKLQVQSSSITTGISIQNADVHTILGNTAGVTNCGSIQVKSIGSSSIIGTINYTLCLNPDGGNVGIGKTGAGSALDISGTTLISGNVGIGVSAPMRNLHGVGEFSWTPGSNNGNVAFFNIHDNVASNGSNYSVVWRGLANSGTTQAKLANFTVDTSILTVNGIVNNLNPSWCMYKDSQTAPTSGTVIVYNTDKVTANNCTTNSGNGRATATKAGRYYVSFGCFTESGLALGSVVELFIRKNGGQYIRNYFNVPYNGYYSSVGTLTCIIDLAVGDYVDVFVSNGALHGNANCCFSGFMIG